MRGHIKLFVLQMDLERAQQLRVAASIGSGLSRDARTSVERVFQQIPQGPMSGR